MLNVQIRVFYRSPLVMFRPIGPAAAASMAAWWGSARLGSGDVVDEQRVQRLLPPFPQP
jgi:hypothetical protein